MSLFPPAPLTHTDLVDRAVRWLRSFHKCSHAFGELSTRLSYIPDAIGWVWEYSILVECKTSRSDFFADRKKLIHANPDAWPGEERWYLTPPGLVRPEEVPDGWYLAEVQTRGVHVVTHPPIAPFTSPLAWDPAWGPEPKRPNPATTPGRWVRERNHERAAAGLSLLLSALRRHEIGVPFDAARGRFETFAERERKGA